MKKIQTILLVPAVLYSLTTLSQITIGNIEEQETKQVAAKTNPKILDSLSDFQVQENWNNYRQYLGHQFYMPPQVGKNYPMLWSIYPKKADPPFNNYYTLINVVGADLLKSQIKDDKLYWYHSVSFNQVSRFPNLIQKVYFVMRNEKDGDTLYWSPNNKKEFIFVPYFAKQKALYEKKVFYYEGYQNMQEKEITDKSRIINISPNSKWICKEVTLLKYSQVMDYAPEDYYEICYVFINDKNESFAKIGNPFYPEIRNDRTDGIKYFISEKEFLEKEQARKKKEQETNSKNEAEIAKQKEDAKIKYQEFVTKYGKTNADLVANHQIKIGFTQEMCFYAWGPLFKSAKIINDQGTIETWKYSNTRILYFVNGTLQQIEQ